MVFVEKAKTSYKDLKENFLSASDYATKTAGTSHMPPVTPVGEGIYAITTTGRESHLAYILTIPNELNEVQKDIGLRERGSFITSLKNPEQKGPANASLGKSPDWPKEYANPSHIWSTTDVYQIHGRVPRLALDACSTKVS